MQKTLFETIYAQRLAYIKKIVYLCISNTPSRVNTKILIIDSDISLATVLADYMLSRGYKAQHISDGRQAIEMLNSSHFDVVLMELQGVGLNGYDLLREIRHREPQLPLIVLTTRLDRESQMRAFQLGCDDYQTKPFSMDILICRIEAILRRTRKDEENKQRVFSLNGVTFDSVHQTIDGQHLSGRENDLLLMLCRNEGEIVDKHAILASLWKADNAFTARSLGVFINHLRNLLKPAEYSIVAVRYRGYKLIKN